MRWIPDSFETTPIVYAVGNNYQIMVPVTKETLMWVEVGGEKYFDEVNGIIRSSKNIHKFTQPPCICSPNII